MMRWHGHTLVARHPPSSPLFCPIPSSSFCPFISLCLFSLRKIKERGSSIEDSFGLCDRTSFWRLWLSSLPIILSLCFCANHSTEEDSEDQEINREKAISERNPPVLQVWGVEWVSIWTFLTLHSTFVWPKTGPNAEKLGFSPVKMSNFLTPTPHNIISLPLPLNSNPSPSASCKLPPSLQLIQHSFFLLFFNLHLHSAIAQRSSSQKHPEKRNYSSTPFQLLCFHSFCLVVAPRLAVLVLLIYLAPTWLFM